MAIGSAGTLPREIPSGSHQPLPRNSRAFWSLTRASPHLYQSPSHVTGGAAPVHCDRPPVTFGDAGSYDSFRVTWGQAGSSCRRAGDRSLSYLLGTRPSATQGATAFLPCPTALVTEREQLPVSLPVALFSTSESPHSSVPRLRMLESTPRSQEVYFLWGAGI